MTDTELRFGRHRLDVRRGELRADDEPVELSPLILRLIAYLAQNRQRTVPIDELRAEVWRGVHVSESALHQAVRQARRAVGDDGRRQEVIRTYARAGYRFVAPVEAPELPAPPPGACYVGRRALVATLDDAVSSAAAGHTRMLAVSGEPGIGKTRTLEEIERRARAAGMHVARGAGSPHAGAPPFWPWVQALRDLARARPLQTLLREIEALEPGLDDSAEAPGIETFGSSRRFRLFDEVARALRGAAALGAVAILLDDVQDASAAVLELFEFLARDLGAAHALLIAVAYRPAEALRSHARAGVIARLGKLVNVVDLELEGLPAGESRELVALRETRPVEPALLEALVERAGGNPFYLVELTRELGGDSRRSRGPHAAAERVARSVHRLISARLATLPSSTRRWLRFAAAYGLNFERASLRALVPEVDDASAVAETLERGLVVEAFSGDGDLAFAHALIRDAVYAEIPVGERRDVHLAIAEQVRDRHPVEAAFHFAEAAPLGSVERTLELLQHAARVARAQFDWETAIALYRRAIDLLEAHAPDERALRCDLSIALGRTAITDGRVDEALEALDAAARLARRHGWPARLARAVLAIADVHDYRGAADEAVIRGIEEALALLDETEAALRAELLSRLAVEVRYRPGGADAADGLLREALQLARRADDVGARARVLEDATLVRWSARDPQGWIRLSRELVRAAREAGQIDLVFRGGVGLVTESMQVGDRRAMERELGHCAELAERFPAPFHRVTCTLMATARHFLAGDFAAAERGVQLSLASDVPEALLPSLTQLYYLHLETGRVELLEDQLRELRDREPHRDSWALALARLCVEGDRLDAARAYLEQTTAPADLARDRLWLPTLALMADVVAALGDEARAADLIQLLEPFAALSAVYGRGTLYYGSVSHYLGLLSRVVGDPDRAESRLLDALSVHDAMRSPPWQIRTSFELATLRAARDGRGYGSVARRLREQASALGMAAIARRVDAELGSRPRAPRPP